MAKKSKSEEILSPRQIMAQRTEELMQTGDYGAIMSTDSQTPLAGLAIPFPLQYLLSVSALPLGIVIECNGAQMSCKSMFVYELGRIFADNNGWLDFIVTEGKISPDLARSVIGWSADRRSAFNPFMCGDMKQWQSTLQNRIVDTINLFEQGDKKMNYSGGATAPVLFAVDSIMGANMEETNKRIETNGFAGRGFAIEALSLTTYLKMIQDRIVKYPFIALFVNHLKLGEVDPSNPYAPRQESRPGGKQLRFQETYELRLTRINKETKLDKTAGGGLEVQYRHIEILNKKNSIGTDGRKINVWVTWRFKQVGDKSYQITKWHWDEATTKMLIDYHKGKLSGTKAVESSLREQLDRFFHIRQVGTANKYWSESLNISSNEAISADQMGRLINSNEKALASLRQAFGITPLAVWTPNTDYREAISQLRSQRNDQLFDAVDQIREEVLQQSDESDNSESSDE